CSATPHGTPAPRRSRASTPDGTSTARRQVTADGHVVGKEGAWPARPAPRTAGETHAIVRRPGGPGRRRVPSVAVRTGLAGGPLRTGGAAPAAARVPSAPMGSTGSAGPISPP